MQGSDVNSPGKRVYTVEEISKILNISRKTRIAKGSGTNIQEVNRLLKQFDQTRKMMKMVTGSKMSQMMGAMRGMKGMR